MSTLLVGPGQTYATLSAAIAVAQDGDTILMSAGVYLNDFSTINKRVSIQGVGGLARLVCTQQIPNGKGILVTNVDVTIDHLEFTGACDGQGNGAGIRHQGGNLTVTQSWFHHCQNGILVNFDATLTVSCDHCEFDRNGYGDGQSHNFYISNNAVGSITNCYSHNSILGHTFKNRANTITATGNRIDTGIYDGSIELDMPDGGAATISNNTIRQGPASSNGNIIVYAEETVENAGYGLGTGYIDNGSGGAGNILTLTSFTGYSIQGKYVTGPGIAANTFVTDIIDGTHVHVNNSQLVGSAGSPISLKFGDLLNPGSSLTVNGNTIINEVPQSSFAFAIDNASTSVVASVNNNTCYGIRQADQFCQNFTGAGNTFSFAAPPAVSTAHPWTGNADDNSETSISRQYIPGGLVTLTQVGNNLTFGPGGPYLRVPGSAPYVIGQYGNTHPVAAVQIETGWEVAWINPDSVPVTYTLWGFNAIGENTVTIANSVLGSDPRILEAESLFQFDINSDGFIPPPPENDGAPTRTYWPGPRVMQCN